MINAIYEHDYFGCRVCGHVWRQPKAIKAEPPNDASN
jgi:hypothetical protein